MNQERLYKVLLGPVVSEKAAAAGDASNQVVFKVLHGSFYVPRSYFFLVCYDISCASEFYLSS